MLLSGCIHTKKTLFYLKLDYMGSAIDSHEKAKNKDEVKKVKLSYKSAEFCLKCQSDKKINYKACCSYIQAVNRLCDSEAVSKKDAAIFKTFEMKSYLDSLASTFDKNHFLYQNDLHTVESYTQYLECDMEPKKFKEEAEDSIYALYTPNKYNHNHSILLRLKEFENFIDSPGSQNNHNYTEAIFDHYRLFTFDGELHSLDAYKKHKNFKLLVKDTTLYDVFIKDSTNSEEYLKLLTLDLNDNIRTQITLLINDIGIKESSYILMQKLLRTYIESHNYKRAAILLETLIKGGKFSNGDKLLAGIIGKIQQTMDMLLKEDSQEPILRRWFMNEHQLDNDEIIRPLFSENHKFVTLISDTVNKTFYEQVESNIESGSVKIKTVQELAAISADEQTWHVYSSGKIVKTGNLITSSPILPKAEENVGNHVIDVFTVPSKNIAFYALHYAEMPFSTSEKDFYHNTTGGNFDIYVVDYTKGNKWERLGNNINTAFSERSPYFINDTLYFSSNGHYGFGGYDVYMSIRMDTTSWTSWSDPINLGKTLNSPFNELNYKQTPKFNCFQSDRENGKFKIFETYNVMPEEEIFFFSGVTVDTATNPIKSVVEVLRVRKKDGLIDPVAKDVSNENGVFLLKYPNDNKDYFYILSFSSLDGSQLSIQIIDELSSGQRDKHIKTKEEIGMDNDLEPDVSIKNVEPSSVIKLVSICVPDKPVMEIFSDKVSDDFKIYFKTGKWLVENRFKDLCKALNIVFHGQNQRYNSNFGCVGKGQTLIMKITAYADVRGNPRSNQILSEKRARAIKEWIDEVYSVKANFSVYYLAEGKGETRKHCGLDDEECWQKNRVAYFVTGGIKKK